MNFKNAIVLTGGISTGKSSVCTLLKSYKFAIIDADKVAHQMLDLQADKIAEMFGAQYVDDGAVIRKKLGILIFSDKNERLKLEAFLHPLIREEIQKQALSYENLNTPYIIDIPLYFETKSYQINEVVVVYCTKEQQLQRLLSRDRLSLEEAQKRINSQVDIDVKKARATYVIDNTKDHEHLEAEVAKFITYIKNLK